LCVRLLVKEQSKRMKLSDVAKHPWIVQYQQSSSAPTASSSASALRPVR
jgi:hypothetical protein